MDGCAFAKALFHVPKHNCWKETQKKLTGQDVKNSRRCKDYVKFSWSEARKVLRAKKRK